MAKDNLLWSDDESDTVSLTGEEEAVLNIDLEARWADDPGKYSVHVHERPDGVAHCSAVRNAPKELDLDGSRLCYGQLLLDQKPRQMATVTWMKELAAAGLPTQGLTRKDARKENWPRPSRNRVPHRWRHATHSVWNRCAPQVGDASVRG